MKKRGQTELSFGMIFSVILIAIFIAFAFYAITKFLDFTDDAKIKSFVSDVQSDINTAWKSSQASDKRTYFLPAKIDEVCFTNDEYENLIFHSSEIVRGSKIEHIDIEKITASGDLCIKNIEGKVALTIKKDFKENLVTIAK